MRKQIVREKRRNNARGRVHAGMRANHALCAYVCYYEILATFRNKARINNGWSLLCAAFHSPHLHKLDRKRVRESPESKMRCLFFFFFLFSLFSIKSRREEKTKQRSQDRMMNARIRVTIVLRQFANFSQVGLSIQQNYRFTGTKQKKERWLNLANFINLAISWRWSSHNLEKRDRAVYFSRPSVPDIWI